MPYINNGNVLPLPRFTGGESDPLPPVEPPAQQPAEPFPNEPGDDPGPQPGDPGPTPPPANMELVPAPISDPLVEMVERVMQQSRDDMETIRRLTESAVNQLCGAIYMTRMTADTVRKLGQDDLRPSLLRELQRETAALAAILVPLCDDRPTVN